ncbi:Uncharacterised protein [Bergeyella zoohelcum]|uniref:Uncharacterized protein n=1 Tax=Bergeyella zoohelcum TaxID=1015 RepID=A0A7Z8YP65_9FLAO|nr:Uncharacterised protein [Bergeyella zoohelcum]
MEEKSIYIIGFSLYLPVLIACIILYLKNNITNIKFLISSVLFVAIFNIIYLISIRILDNSYEGILLVYASIVLNLISIPTIIVLFILRFFLKK